MQTLRAAKEVVVCSQAAVSSAKTEVRAAHYQTTNYKTVSSALRAARSQTTNYKLPFQTATSTSGTVNLFISNEECGVTQVKSMDPKGLNSSLVLHLLHDKELNTGEDRAYLLQCFIGTPQEDAELSTNLDVIRSELAIAETISLSTFPPTCSYSIRKDNPDGPIVTKALVGQTVYHRWDCDGSDKTTNAYGIQVHSCYASDDVERKFAFVDPRGCSSDLALLTDLTYAEDSLTAWAASHVFSVHVSLEKRRFRIYSSSFSDFSRDLGSCQKTSFLMSCHFSEC